MTEGENMLEICARAIYDATDPLSGDNLATLIIASDHLFPQREHLEGNPTSKAYQLAAMDVCRTAARAVIEALMEPTPEMLAAGVMAHFEFIASGSEPHAANFARFQFGAMLRTALSQPNDEGEGK